MGRKILKLTKAEKLLILLLAANNKESIGSVFKLEMMVFLISKTDNALDDFFKFVPSKRGPHSAMFHRALNGLIKKGLIEFGKTKS